MGNIDQVSILQIEDAFEISLPHAYLKTMCTCATGSQQKPFDPQPNTGYLLIE